MKTRRGQELKDLLAELYVYYFGEVKQRLDSGEQDEYKTGRFSGGLDAVSAIFFALYGGRELMDLWNSQIENDSEGGTDDKTTGG